MKTRYDMIASLGGNCSAAIQLKNRGLRREAYPLDWVYMEDEKSVAYLAKGFENGFSDLALAESWPTELGFSGGERFVYDAYPYSFDFASHEWAFLDDVELNGFTKPQLCGWARTVYKIWKKSGKWLNNRGYGVSGVSF